MKILFTSSSTKGSWKIRGEQMAGALQARAVLDATPRDCLAADLIVLVKRADPELLRIIRKSGRPWAYDIVDAYPQPQCSAWDEDDSSRWLRSHLLQLAPPAMIWPNARMMADASWTGGPQLVLYHHHRPGLRINPIRTEIKDVGYEGSPRYLKGWEMAIADACKRLGAVFHVNPPSLADMDVVLALRGPEWNGYPQQSWKSNVKLANAHASGTPFIGQPEYGYREMATGAEYWATTAPELHRAFAWLESQSAREEVSARFLKAAYPLERCAENLRDFLKMAVLPCAAKS